MPRPCNPQRKRVFTASADPFREARRLAHICEQSQTLAKLYERAGQQAHAARAKAIGADASAKAFQLAREVVLQ